MHSMIQARSAFVILFYMLWTFVLGNIFIGVIASAFEAIRQDQDTVATDSQSKCLVCSLDMYCLDEHVEGGFEDHMDPELYSGAESAVARTVVNLKTSTAKGSWLPINRSIAYRQALELEKLAQSGLQTR
ncbi:MAG: hypothetical protein WDW38_002898 [Sanguina aurantia]